MTCRQAEKWMDAACDGALTGAPAAELRRHLDGCAACAAQWRLLESAEAALRVPRPVPAPEGMLADFRRRLAAEAPAPRPSPWRWLWPTASLAGAGSLAALLAALRLFPTGGAAPERVAGLPPAALPGLGAPVGPETRPGLGGAPDASPALPPEARKGLGGGAPDASPAGPGADRSPAPAPSARPTAPPRPTSPAGEARAESLAFGRAPATPLPRPLAIRPKPSAAPIPFAAAEPESMGRARGARPGGDALTRLERGPAGPIVPVALDAEVLFAQAQVLPPEFNVSTAVLAALQRPVDVTAGERPVREVLALLSERADVVLSVDPGVAPLRVSVRREGEPLWLVLQSVAQQGSLRIYPEQNRLVLRGEPDVVRKVGEPPAPPAAARAVLPGLAGPAPDRTVWPAAWGNLPERGFEPPAPEDLPATVGAVPTMRRPTGGAEPAAPR